MKDAVVKITDRHVQDGEEYTCELTTGGSLDFRPDGFTVVYNETDEELKGCCTELKYSNGTIVMTRTGKYNTELIIEKGVRHNCAYSTPYGELMVGITATDFESRKQGTLLRLRMNYTVDFYGDINQTKEMTVVVGKPVAERKN